MKRLIKYLLISALLFVVQACAAQRSNTDAIMDVGKIIELGTAAIEEGNLGKAYLLILPLAETDNAEAQFTIAQILGSDHFPVKLMSRKEADSKVVSWLQKASLNGHSQSIHTLSDIFANGWYGQSKNEEIAACWLSLLELKNDDQRGQCRLKTDLL